VPAVPWFACRMCSPAAAYIHAGMFAEQGVGNGHSTVVQHVSLGMLCAEGCSQAARQHMSCRLQVAARHADMLLLVLLAGMALAHSC
jgi:hypothetical protein